MTWTWKRTGPREWRVVQQTTADELQDEVLRRLSGQRNAERPCVSDETWWRVRAALRPWASVLPKGWENST